MSLCSVYSFIYYSANGPDTLLLVIRKPAITTFIVNETPRSPAAVVFNNPHRLLLYLGFCLGSISHPVLRSEVENSSVFFVATAAFGHQHEQSAQLSAAPGNSSIKHTRLPETQLCRRMMRRWI